VITADTITDEQIRELLEECRRSDNWGSDAYWDAEDALWIPVGDPRRGTARARCAEILNARSAK